MIYNNSKILNIKYLYEIFKSVFYNYFYCICKYKIKILIIYIIIN